MFRLFSKLCLFTFLFFLAFGSYSLAKRTMLVDVLTSQKINVFGVVELGDVVIKDKTIGLE